MSLKARNAIFSFTWQTLGYTTDTALPYISVGIVVVILFISYYIPISQHTEVFTCVFLNTGSLPTLSFVFITNVDGILLSEMKQTLMYGKETFSNFGNEN